MNDFANFDRAAEYYDQTRGFPEGMDVAVAQFIVDEIGIQLDSHLLEVGIGTGRIAVPLASHIKHIAGIDISRAMLNKLIEKSPKNPIHAVEGDAMRLPYPDDFFDVCMSVHVFHLIPDMEQCIQEINRVLKPDGVLLYCGGPAHPTFDDLEAVWDKHVPKYIGAPQTEDVQEVLKKHGWQIPEHPLKYEGFTLQKSPAGFIDMMRNRKRSATWRMSDEELANAVAELETVAHENYDDPTTMIDLPASFYVWVYRRA